ncbi:MAG: hypothetical protein ACEQSA_02615 [Weeksellaceae bacterium]
MKLVRPDVLSKYTLWEWQEDRWEWRFVRMNESFPKWPMIGLTPKFVDVDQNVRVVELEPGKIEPQDSDHYYGESYVVTTRPSHQPWRWWSWRTWSVVIAQIVVITALLVYQFGPKTFEQKLVGPMPTTVPTTQATSVANAPAITATAIPTVTSTPTPLPVASEPLVIELDKAYPQSTWWQLAGPDVQMPEGWQIPVWLQSQDTAVAYPMPQGMDGYVVIIRTSGYGLTAQRTDDNLEPIVGSKVDLFAQSVTIRADELVWGVAVDGDNWSVSSNPQGNITLHAQGKGLLVIEANQPTWWQILLVVGAGIVIGVILTIGWNVVRNQ